MTRERYIKNRFKKTRPVTVTINAEVDTLIDKINVKDKTKISLFEIEDRNTMLTGPEFLEYINRIKDNKDLFPEGFSLSAKDKITPTPEERALELLGGDIESVNLKRKINKSKKEVKTQEANTPHTDDLVRSKIKLRKIE
jgi:hypothetical protein